MQKHDGQVPIHTRLSAAQVRDLDELSHHDPGKNSRAAQIRSAIALYLAKDYNLRILMSAAKEGGSS